jgi:caffeoyl-CoA O-methyltransferase
MKGNRTLVNDDLYNYINNLYVVENKPLVNIKRLYNKYNIPEISITPEQGKFLYILSKIINAKKILEVGTLIGYSTIWLYNSLPYDGKIFTIEVSKKHYTIAKEYFREYGLLNKIEILKGRALDMIDDLKDISPFDMIFIDADKERYSQYYDFAYQLLRPGGLFTIDNTLSKGRVIDESNNQKGVIETHKLNNMLGQDKEFCSILIPIADGISIGLKQ